MRSLAGKPIQHGCLHEILRTHEPHRVIPVVIGKNDDDVSRLRA